MIKQLTVYCDGACPSNPGPMGWAAIAVQHTGGQSVLCKAYTGKAPWGTDNLAELLAILEALKRLEPRDQPVTILSDSLWAVTVAKHLHIPHVYLTVAQEIWNRIEGLQANVTIESATSSPGFGRSGASIARSGWTASLSFHW